MLFNSYSKNFRLYELFTLWTCHVEQSETRQFGLFPVRSPLLRESLTIYFPLLTKMFQFSRYPSTRLTAGDSWSLNQEDFSIRTSSDQSLFGSSPRLIAASHVFHRLLTPRHPPYALSSLIIINSNLTVRAVTPCTLCDFQRASLPN